MTRELSEFQVGDLEELGGEKILLAVNIDANGVNSWLADNADHVKRLFKSNGALLIRGLPIQGSKKLERVLTTFFDNSLLEYNYRSTPRTKMRGRIYTSSEYHPEETIGLHNENAYSNDWAMKIAFYCVKPSEQGGATPIADSRKIYDSIPSEIRDKFEQKKLMYVRNYGDIDLSWTEVFQTDDKAVVEEYCQNNHIEFEWKGENGLRTRQKANATYVHPLTGENVWFNQAHLFHISSLKPENRESMENTFKKEDLPRNVYYADGEEIECDDLAVIRNIYLKNKIIFDWHEGDLLLLDNMLYAHGREPYEGNRRVLVGMSTAMNADNESLQTPQVMAIE